MDHNNLRRQVGELLPPFEVETLAHGRLSVPAVGELVHLQFRRFAGCPVCNLHLRRFSRAHTSIRAAGVRTVSLFYSPREVMLSYQHELPQPVVPDPTRQHFAAFGVERSRWAAANPRAWVTAMAGMVSGATNPFEGGAQDGLPADFLIAPAVGTSGEARGRIVALHYGSSVDNQWSVDDVLELARVHALPASMPPARVLPPQSPHTTTGDLHNEPAYQ